MSTLCVGIDLAWSTGLTGLAAVDDAGALIGSATVRTDDEIAAWIDALPGPVAVAAIDAPLLVPNETGQRPGEIAIARAFGSYKIGAHTANRGRPGMDPPRGAVLAERFGWSTRPTYAGSAAWPVGIEVYPHPAMVSLFGLDERLPYKSRFAVDVRRDAFDRLLAHLESLAEMRLTGHARWQELRAAAAAATTQAALDRIEDEVDAVLCAHLAWLWHRRPGTLQVYGDTEAGYVVAPPPPTRPVSALMVDIDPAHHAAIRDALQAMEGVRGVRPVAPSRRRARSEVG